MKNRKRLKNNNSKFKLPEEERENCAYLLDLIIGFNKRQIGR